LLILPGRVICLSFISTCTHSSPRISSFLQPV
jgi:hypothetical protein